MSADRTRVARRAFLGGAVALAACKKSPPKPKEGAVPSPTAPSLGTAMPMRPLGRTGVNVSLVGLGGFHLGSVKDEAEAIRIIHSAIDRGVTFMDNCWDYHEGKSEERMGKALEGRRDRVFLMTKIDGRTRQSATEQLEQSLRRMKTDRIDLVQIHEVIRANDPERCFAPDGCLAALVDAQRAGKLRFIGFTGHKDPSIHNAMLDAAAKAGFHFDAVQLPLNVMDAHYRSFEKETLPKLVADGIAVLGMKSLGSGKILETKRVSAVECLHYAMNLPTSVVITGCDSMGVLDQAIHAALTFRPLGPQVVTELLERTRAPAAKGEYEVFKTTDKHDGTTEHPEWLESSQI